MTDDQETEVRLVETDESTLCTISPVNAADEEVVTTWITAGEDSFVALEDAR